MSSNNEQEEIPTIWEYLIAFIIYTIIHVLDIIGSIFVITVNPFYIGLALIAALWVFNII